MAEVSTRIQRARDAFLSPAILLNTELLRALEDTSQKMRGVVNDNSNTRTEDTEVDKLTPEAQMTRQMLIDTMKRGLEKCHSLRNAILSFLAHDKATQRRSEPQLGAGAQGEVHGQGERRRHGKLREHSQI